MDDSLRDDLVDQAVEGFVDFTGWVPDPEALAEAVRPAFEVVVDLVLSQLPAGATAPEQCDVTGLRTRDRCDRPRGHRGPHTHELTALAQRARAADEEYARRAAAERFADQVKGERDALRSTLRSLRLEGEAKGRR